MSGNNGTTTQIQEVITSLTTALNDADKHDRGVKAAGTRLRKTLLDITKAAKSIRAEILEAQKNNN